MSFNSKITFLKHQQRSFTSININTYIHPYIHTYLERERERERNVPGNKATTSIVALLMPTRAGHQITHTQCQNIILSLSLFLSFGFSLVRFSMITFLLFSSLLFSSLYIKRMDDDSRQTWPHRNNSFWFPRRRLSMRRRIIQQAVAVTVVRVSCRENLRERKKDCACVW